MSKAWMPFYGGDFLSNTMHLSRGDVGSYMFLLLHHWEHGSLPSNETELRRIARVTVTPQWPRVWAKLRPLFKPSPDGPDRMVQTRVLAELSKAREISSKRKAAAQQMLSKRRAYAQQMHTQSQSQSHKKEGVAGNGVSGKAVANVQVGEVVGDHYWTGSFWQRTPEGLK